MRFRVEAAYQVYVGIPVYFAPMPCLALPVSQGLRHAL